MPYIDTIELKGVEYEIRSIIATRDAGNNIIHTTYAPKATTIQGYGITTGNFSDTTQATSASNASVTFSGGVGIAKNMYVGGEIYATKVHNAIYNDYAEYFERGENTEPGDIIMLDINSSKEQYIKAVKGQGPIVGVDSDTWAHIIGGLNETNAVNTDLFIPVGLQGRVWVKVNGSPKKGDYIGASDIPGVGEVCDKSEAIGFVVDDTSNQGKVKIKLI